MSPAPRERHSVRIALGGMELTVSSEHPPEYTRQVAEYFDGVLARIRQSVPNADAHRVALLAGLAITDELFQAREGDVVHAARLRGMTDRISRLVPAKRGGGSKGA